MRVTAPRPPTAAARQPWRKADARSYVAAPPIQYGVGPQPQYGGYPIRRHPPADAEDKTTAVLLAVYLGFWTWLYTYKKDA